MADNTIDSLEIKIESSADQAVRSLENLSAKLTTIKNTLGKLSMPSAMENVRYAVSLSNSKK